MSKYNLFLTLFILSVVSVITFFIFYFRAIMGVAFPMQGGSGFEHDPGSVFRQIFSIEVIISFIVMVISSLVYRIVGIVLVVRNTTVSDGERALWIVGFIFLGFVTSIVFLLMAKGRKYVD